MKTPANLIPPGRTSLAGAMFAAFALIAAPAANAVDFSYTGFASLVGGRVLDGTPRGEFYDYHCPCFISDYTHAGVYEDGKFAINKESRVGVQGTLNFTQALSATAQVTSRGTDTSPSLEWAYLSYKLSTTLTVQAGRKRVPLFFYSDYQDIGTAYPWVRPPQELYGWYPLNYEGINLLYKDSWGEWAVQGNLVLGHARDKKSVEQQLYGSYPQDTRWDRLGVVSLELNRDWFTTRLIYLRSANVAHKNDPVTGIPAQVYPDPAVFGEGSHAPQRGYGVAFNIDYENWLVRSEFNTLVRQNGDDKNPSMSVGAGYTFGKWTPFINYSMYWEKLGGVNDPAYAERQHNASATLRYDWSSKTAVKVQFDRFRDHSGALLPFTGNSRLLSFSVDTTF